MTPTSNRKRPGRNGPDAGLGDFQTPDRFAEAVCERLRRLYPPAPQALLEPTCGEGSLAASALAAFGGLRQVFGIEIDPGRFRRAAARLGAVRGGAELRLYNEDVFRFDFSRIARELAPADGLLAVGNPPWVANSRLGALGSRNLPEKRNLKGLPGLDALTGKGDFDLAEAVVLRILAAFRGFRLTLAMLVKATVARNVVRDLGRLGLPVSSADLHVFDAGEVFGVSCEAGLLVLRAGDPPTGVCSVYDFPTGAFLRRFGWRGGSFYSDLGAPDPGIGGRCAFEWRQGIKHDCARVMELTPAGGGAFRNGLGEEARLPEGKSVFPLAKSSDLRSPVPAAPGRRVVVPQRRPGEDTSRLREEDPEVWRYLSLHRDLLASRRSAVYRGAPEFAVFGVGPYSFARFKAGVSGFYKEPVFALIAGDPPCMLDDTCYFLPFDCLTDAAITVALLNTPECLSFLKSVAFLDSKRPYTKEVLMRVDLGRLALKVGWRRARGLVLAVAPSCGISESVYDAYRRRCVSSPRAGGAAPQRAGSLAGPGTRARGAAAGSGRRGGGPPDAPRQAP
ncbi:MAG: class I SAM-dependent methyltransferase [Deltaproteobacteria bacterium]|jgi:hypothetical protein|nr:class I SAM-dependent methyltransferase [Deltaproteobacteria bacterium]